jgi:hypothetical protein
MSSPPVIEVDPINVVPNTSTQGPTVDPAQVDTGFDVDGTKFEAGGH